MTYRPEIDGLRAVAVMPVIFFHLGYAQFKGGYYGVDVFFVISGYLITNILVNDIVNDTFSMQRFWIKRIKRLLPLLLAVIAFVLLIAPFLLYKPMIKNLANDIFPALFSYFNFHALWDFGSYWGRASEESLFLHTWSLSIEEQFYLLYPSILFLSNKYFKSFVIPILVITGLSIALFVVGLHKAPNATFFMLPTRAWELGLGGLAAFINLKNLRGNYANALSFLGISLVTLTYVLANTKIDLFVFLPVFGTFLIIVFTSQRDAIGRLLSTRLFVYLGKISYSLYLWHWIFIVLKDHLDYSLHGINDHVVNMAVLAVTVLFSMASFTFIESKTRYNANTPKVVLVAVLLISGTTLYLKSNVFDTRYTSEFNESSFFGFYYDITPSQALLLDWFDENDLLQGVFSPDRPVEFREAYKTSGITSGDHTNGSPRMMLFGDSHGGMWAKLIEDISKDLNRSLSIYTSNGTKPFFHLDEIESQTAINGFTKKERTEYAKSVLSLIDHSDLEMVVIACRWETMSSLDWVRFDDLLKLLESQEIEVLVINQPPVLDFIVNQSANQYFSYLGFAPKRGFNVAKVMNPEPVLSANQKVVDVASKYSNISMFDVYETYSEDGKVRITHHDDILYFDDDHLTYEGTLISKQDLFLRLQSMIQVDP